MAILAQPMRGKGEGRCSALWRSLRLAVLALALWGRPVSAGEALPANEYQIKAVFLFNFAQFVDWPPRAFVEPDAPLVIGVLGDDPFGPYLDETVKGEKINGRSLVVRRYRRVEEIAVCHVLFISRSESPRLGEIIGQLKGRNILTVGDAEDFSRRAGMIRFVTANNKIRLHINVESARAAEIAISSKLLRPALIVTSEKG